jgi:hypothetical protein
MENFDMSVPFQVLVKRSSLLKYGLLGIVAGIGLAGFGLASDQSMPERAALQKIEGQITKATQVTTKRKRGGESVRYQLEVKGAAAEPITITIPQKDISEAQVRSLLPTRIAAEFDAENDVYVLTSNGRPVLTYENSVKSRQDGNKALEIMGALLSAFSAFIAAIGFWWTRRKVAKEVAAWEAEHAAQADQAQHAPQTAA